MGSGAGEANVKAVFYFSSVQPFGIPLTDFGFRLEAPEFNP